MSYFGESGGTEWSVEREEEVFLSPSLVFLSFSFFFHLDSGTVACRRFEGRNLGATI